jgi:hypothetical protein
MLNDEFGLVPFGVWLAFLDLMLHVLTDENKANLVPTRRITNVKISIRCFSTPLLTSVAVGAPVEDTASDITTKAKVEPNEVSLTTYP